MCILWHFDSPNWSFFILVFAFMNAFICTDLIPHFETQTRSSIMAKGGIPIFPYSDKDAFHFQHILYQLYLLWRYNIKDQKFHPASQNCSCFLFAFFQKVFSLLPLLFHLLLQLAQVYYLLYQLPIDHWLIILGFLAEGSHHNKKNWQCPKYTWSPPRPLIKFQNYLKNADPRPGSNSNIFEFENKLTAEDSFRQTSKMGYLGIFTL